jgi:CRISPR-associated protein Cmr4
MSSKVSGLSLAPYDSGDLILVESVTNIHPGIGRFGGVVDMPVQRDHLGYPVIYASSLKGSLKSALFNVAGNESDKGEVKLLLGPEPDEDEKFASALAILDAHLLLFPVRSLEGVYALATSPFLLSRLKNLMELLNKKDEKLLNAIDNLIKVPITKEECLISDTSTGLIIEKLGCILINEEIMLKPKKDDNVKELECKLNYNRIIVLNDNTAMEALERSLVKVTRIRLERSTKVVERGGLWSEEYIPHGSVFFTAFLYSQKLWQAKSKQTSGSSTSQSSSSSDPQTKFKDLLNNKLRNYLIIGGKESVGRGIVKLNIL